MLKENLENKQGKKTSSLTNINTQSENLNPLFYFLITILMHLHK